MPMTFAVLQTLGRADRQQPAAAADIQNALIAAQRERIEHLVAQLQLGDTAGPHHHGTHRQEDQADQRQHAAHARGRSRIFGTVYEVQHQRDAEDPRGPAEHAADDARGV